MDLTFLQEYLVLVVFGICLCVGYIIKNSLDVIPNKYIPLLMGVIGVVLTCWLKMSFTPEVLLAGLFSGLAATGCYELFRNLIEKAEKYK